jgi:hypothetical protein
MDPKEFKQLMRMVDENNRMISKMRGAQKRAWWLSFFKYVIFIAIALGAWYTVQPLIENLDAAYNSVIDGVESIQNVGDSVGGIFNRN